MPPKEKKINQLCCQNLKKSCKHNRPTDLGSESTCRGRAPSNLFFIMFDRIGDFGGESRCPRSARPNRRSEFGQRSICQSFSGRPGSVWKGTQLHHIVTILSTNCCAKRAESSQTTGSKSSIPDSVMGPSWLSSSALR